MQRWLGGLAALFLSASLLAGAGPAAAHPHVFIDARAEIVFDDSGRISGVRHVWRFDDGFSAYASQGFDGNRDGVFTLEELQPLAQVNVESLKPYHYFTYVDAGGKQSTFADPAEYWLQYDDGLLTLFYTLPLAEPVPVGGDGVTIDIYDPEYFVAVGFVPDAPVTLKNAPAGCTVAFEPPKDVDPMTATQLALIPADQRELPENLRQITRALANIATVTCPERSSVAPVAAADEGPARPAGGPFGVAPPDATGAPSNSFFAAIAAWQSAFYARLTGAVKAIGADPTAALLLVALSFGYGIFHAAGPGHGKAVISAYLAVSGAGMRRALLLSFLAAFVQATVAVALVGVLAAVLGLTSIAMGAATGWIELAAAIMVTALGAVLTWRKVVAPLLALAGREARRFRTEPEFGAALFAAAEPAGSRPKIGPRLTAAGARGPSASASISAGRPAAGAPALRGIGTGKVATHTVGSCDCGVVHGIIGAELAGGGWRDAAAAAVASGIRPCTGALIVLTFALSQHQFLAGVASAYAMALGTGATVALIALATVGAKGALVRLAAGAGSPVAARVGAALEGTAAAVVLAFGGVLLGAALAAA